MSIATKRAAIAAGLTTRLAATPYGAVKIDPYRSAHPGAFQGWVQIEQYDSEDTTLGETRIKAEACVLVATERTDFEMAADILGPLLIDSLEELDCRAVTVRLYTEVVESTTWYHLSAAFLTESL